MAKTLSGDVKLYDEQFQGGFVETIQQNVAAFNAASQGGLVMRNNIIKGDYQKEAFWDEVFASAVARRDPTADGTATATKLTQDEFIGVKLDRRNGPFEANVDAFRRIGSDWMSISRILGVQGAKAVAQEQLNRSLAAIEAKLDATATLENDKASTGTMLTEYLAQALAKFGDASSNILIWVMHSKVYWDLVQDQLSDAVYRANGTQIVNGSPVTLGRPVLVTDATALLEADAGGTGTDHYSTLGLAAGAGVVDISAPPIAVLEGPLTGRDNLYLRFQVEYSYNLRLRGCKYKTATGANPTDANVADASNWTTVVADKKLLPGVIIKTQ